MGASEVEQLIDALELMPHPEGGHYREIFRAADLPCELPLRGRRSAVTSIYFLLEGAQFSAFHRVRSDEIWYHHRGSPLELYTLDPERGLGRVVLGSRIERGERPQCVVPANVYQAARLSEPGFALSGCSVAPGFDFADFEMPPRAALGERFPEWRELIAELTRA
jgi:predicted cupin superfamily sugar epimerase